MGVLFSRLLILDGEISALNELVFHFHDGFAARRFVFPLLDRISQAVQQYWIAEVFSDLAHRALSIDGYGYPRNAFDMERPRKIRIRGLNPGFVFGGFWGLRVRFPSERRTATAQQKDHA